MPRFLYTPTVPHAGNIGELIARRGQIAGERARAIADAQARAAMASGQAWGNAAGSIGDVISRGIMDYRQEKMEAPIRAQQLEAGRQQNELGRLQLASARQGVEDKAILGSAQGSGLDPEHVKAQLAKLGRGDLIPIYEQTHASIETARLGLQKTRMEVVNLEADYFGAIAVGVKKAKYDPLAVKWALAQADADGHDTTQIRGLLQQNPQALPTIIDTLIEKSQTQQKLIGEDTDRKLKRQTEARALANMQADNARATATAAEVARHNAEQEHIAALTAGRQEAQATETERHNRAMEARPTAGSQPAFQAKEVLGDDGQPVMASFDPRSNTWVTPAGQPIQNPRPVPSAMETQDARKFKQAEPILQSVSELSERINTGKGLIARLSGGVERAKAQANYNDDVAEYQAVVSGFTPLVARALGHTGILTQQDVDSVKMLFPKPGDSKSLRDRKVARIKSIIGDLETNANPQGNTRSPAGGGDLDDWYQQYLTGGAR